MESRPQNSKFRKIPAIFLIDSLRLTNKYVGVIPVNFHPCITLYKEHIGNVSN